ncbi:hypothetical protein ACHAXN_008022 [Cyclotella atomus]
MGSETTAAAPPLSKRQRRLRGSHPSTTWQQQPRIKSSSARAKAYITYAGLTTNARGSHKTIDPKLDLNSPEIKFGRLLASTDQRKRHTAVQALQSYLRARSDINSGEGISELDLLKLWKGLWYTLYMCDKVPVQDRLSEILSETMWCLGGSEEDDEYAGQVYLRYENGFEDDDEEEEIEEEEEGSIDQDIEKYMEEEMDSDDDYKLLSVEEVDEESEEEEGESAEDEKHCRGAHLVSLYIATFLRTVRREWGNVDKYRVDKFYTAVRLMLSEAYKYMAKRYWNMGIVRLFNDVLYDEALSQTPNGLRYHIIDICVEELAKVNKEAAVSLTEATFLDCLEPFFAMVQRVQDRNVQKRVVDNVMMKFLNEYSFVSDAAVSEEEDVDGKDLIFHQVHVGTVAKFIFEIASDGDTDVRYRKCLYEMHKTFIRKIRAAGRDVDTEAGRDEEEAEAEEDGCGACGTSETCVVVTPIDGATVTPDGTDEKASKEEPLSKKDKKKKRKNKDKAKKGVEEPDAAAAADPEPKVEESAPATKSSKKKKRKQQQETASEPAAIAPSNDANETEQSNTKKKKRKKEAQEDETLTTKIELPPVSKKKKKNQKAAEPEIAVNSNGEVVATSDGEEQGNAISASKRVSFGARNQSKSHKASMKALKTLTPKVWSTANRTPDKSILLKRAESEVKQIKTKKKKRRST